MRYFSMFSGIGGFELGIERAFGKAKDSRKHLSQQSRSGECLRPKRNKSDNKVQRTKTQQEEHLSESGCECIGFSEIDRYAVKVYQSHFPDHKNFGDATRIVPEELPDFDMLVGGFPCQAFSIAGKRLGFDDTRGTLFFDIARVLKIKKPRQFVLENVKGLLSHDQGRSFKVIIATLVEMGYSVEWQVLNSKYHGVPQNRERVFIRGYLGDIRGREIFPLGGTDEEDHGTDLRADKTDNGSGGGKPDGINTKRRASSAEDIRPVLTLGRPQKRQHGRRMKDNGDPSFTVTSQDQHGVFIRDKQNR